MRSFVASEYGAVLHLLLLLCGYMLVQCQTDDLSNSTCSTFLADVIGSAETESYEDTFTCGDGAYVAGVNISFGWWIDGLSIVCSNGIESGWYGASESVNESFVDTGEGLLSISSYFKEQDGHAFPCLVAFFANTSPSASEIGPYGSCGRSSSSSFTSNWDTDSGEFNRTSECGSGSYAIGFLLHYGTVAWIYGLGLQCRRITPACPIPDGLAVPTPETAASYTLQPTPVPVQETLEPHMQLSTLAPVQETPAPTDPIVGLGGDCSENACVEGLCCSKDERCGATASFCSEGLCCRTPDKRNCAAGLNQCTIEEDADSHWYEDPFVIGTSTALGFIVTLGSTSYAIYRYFCRERADSQ